VPDRSDHIARAGQNEKLAGQMNLNETWQVDWAIILLFYSALQYVDAFLAGKNMHPKDHGARDAEIGNNGSLQAIYDDYRKLKDKSRAARYEVPNFHRSQLPPIEQRFQRIKTHIMNLLQPSVSGGGARHKK
jgi:hypothetical protein